MLRRKIEEHNEKIGLLIFHCTSCAHRYKISTQFVPDDTLYLRTKQVTKYDVTVVTYYIIVITAVFVHVAEL